MGEGAIEAEELSTVTETIRRDIENAHDERTLTDGHYSISDVPTVLSHRLHGSVLSRLRIAAGYRWQNRFERLRCWFFQLRPIFVVTGTDCRRILIERQARDNPSNLNSIQRLAFQQALSQTNHRVAILFDDRLCSFKLSGDDLLHLLIDLDGSVFREITMLGNFTSEEDLLFLLAEGQGTHLRHAVFANHRAREFSRTFDIV